MAKSPERRSKRAGRKAAPSAIHMGSVHVSGEPGWEKLIDDRIKKGREELIAWKQDDILRAYCERVLNGDRKKLVGW